MVVGNSLSGQDISIELVEVAKEVHLSAKSLTITEGLSKVLSKHENLHLHPQVSVPGLLSSFYLRKVQTTNFYYYSLFFRPVLSIQCTLEKFLLLNKAR